MQMSIDEIFDCIRTGRNISPVSVVVEKEAESLQDISFSSFEHRKKDIKNRLAEFEDEITGRNMSFREKVTVDG